MLKTHKFPSSSAFRPVASDHTPKSTDTTTTDSSMKSIAHNISDEKGMSGSGNDQFVYRRMEQKQRMGINAYGSSKHSQKKLNKFYGNMGGVYDSKSMEKMYGVYQDNKGDEIMFENVVPARMAKGDRVFNNICGEIGVLQDVQDRGDDVVLVFQDRSFRVLKNSHGWSKEKLLESDGNTGPYSGMDKTVMTDDSIQGNTGPIAASSAQGPALFKEQVEGPNGHILKKILAEVDHQDDPHSIKQEIVEGTQVEKEEHEKTIVKIEKENPSVEKAASWIAKDHVVGENMPTYYDKLKKMESAAKGMFADDAVEEDDDDDWNDVEVADGSAPMSQRQRKAAGDWTPKVSGYQPVSPAQGKQAATGLMHTYTPSAGTAKAITPHYGTAQRPTTGAPHEMFHRDISTVLHSHGVPEGSHVSVEHEGKRFFGTFKGAGKPLGAVSGSKHVEQYKSHFEKRDTGSISVGALNIKHFKQEPRAKFSGVQTPDEIESEMQGTPKPEISVSHQEKETYMKQLSRAPSSPMTREGPGMSKAFKKWQPETRAGNRPVGPKNQYDFHQREQLYIRGSARTKELGGREMRKVNKSPSNDPNTVKFSSGAIGSKNMGQALKVEHKEKPTSVGAISVEGILDSKNKSKDRENVYERFDVKP